MFFAFAYGSEYKNNLIKKLALAGEPYDLSYTLIAIARVESNFGQVKINLQDPSCGVTMIHLKFYIKKLGIKDTPFNRNLVCSRLIENDDASIAEAVAILTYAKKRFCGKYGCTKAQWRNIWGYYNAGERYAGKAGREYSSKIEKFIKKLKK